MTRGASLAEIARQSTEHLCLTSVDIDITGERRRVIKRTLSVTHTTGLSHGLETFRVHTLKRGPLFQTCRVDNVHLGMTVTHHKYISMALRVRSVVQIHDTHSTTASKIRGVGCRWRCMCEVSEREARV